MNGCTGSECLIMRLRIFREVVIENQMSELRVEDLHRCPSGSCYCKAYSRCTYEWSESVFCVCGMWKNSSLGHRLSMRNVRVSPSLLLLPPILLPSFFSSSLLSLPLVNLKITLHSIFLIRITVWKGFSRACTGVEGNWSEIWNLS